MEGRHRRRCEGRLSAGAVHLAAPEGRQVHRRGDLLDDSFGPGEAGRRPRQLRQACPRHTLHLAERPETHRGPTPRRERHAGVPTPHREGRSG